MSWSAFLTRRWNLGITVVQGVPTFLFVVWGLVSPVGGTFAGMVGLSVAGAFF